MVKIFFSIVFMFQIIVSAHAQIDVFRGRVVDSETGDAMPYVNVLAGENRGTVTNMEGDFAIRLTKGDTLQFSFVGYQPRKIAAAQLSQFIQLQPLPLAVNEVTVLSDYAILMNVYEQLAASYNVLRQRLYFNRITVKTKQGAELVEDIMEANSTVNVRDMKVLSGSCWTYTPKGWRYPSQLQRSNLHVLMMTGPMMLNNPLGKNYFSPFPQNCSVQYLQQNYSVTMQTVVADDGKQMHILDLQPKEGLQGILSGRMYVDAETYRLYRFDGIVQGIGININRFDRERRTQGVPAAARMQLIYDYSNGVPEVKSFLFKGRSEELDVTMLLLETRLDERPKKGIAVRSNLIDAIGDAGNKIDMDEHKNTILRTREEAAVAGQSITETLSDIPSAPVPTILSHVQKAMNFNRVVPQEKVYLHFDNTGYFENETMWFKAYVTRTDNGKPTDLSKVLYVELLNPSGDVLQTMKYPIDSLGQAYGEMKMDTILGAGYYEVRAYTRYMTNWGVNAAFSRVFPVFKAPATEGDYSNLTISPIHHRQSLPSHRTTEDSLLYGNTISQGISNDHLNTSVSVQFYPEGGNLVAGKKNRVAMLAVDDNGRAYQGNGFVTDSLGEVLVPVQTDSLGRGVFEVVPTNTSLSLQLKNLKDKVQFYPLPEAQKEGCALMIDAVSDTLLATLQCTDSLCGSPLAYVLMHNGNIFRCDTMCAVPLIEIELNRDSLPEGVSQITVFDSYGRIWAERLFFRCPVPKSSDSIMITTKTPRLTPCGKVEVELYAQPNSNISFSAIDCATMNNGKQGNMKTWMLLSSEVRGYIHNPEYYFESDDKEHRQSADLLMLTQGWRRYDWELMTGQREFEKIQPIEDKFYVFGKLNVYRKRNPVNNVRLEVYLYNREGQSLKGETVTDSVGNYAFAMPFVDGDWDMQIFTRKKNKKGKDKRKTYYVGIDRQFSPTPRYITPLEASARKRLLPNLFLMSMEEPEDEDDVFIPITKRDHVLQNVTVKAKRRYFTNDDYMYKNEEFGKIYASLYYNAAREADKILDMGEPLPSLSNFVYSKLNTHYDWTGENPQLYKGRGVQYIYNNGERDPVYPAGLTWLDEVKSIYIVLNGKNSVTMEQMSQTNSPIFVYVYNRFVYTTESQKGLRRTYFQGFNKPSTFQMEDYSILPPMADFRRTIYWNPNVKTDASGKAKVEFFNNSTCQEMYISAEGITPDGKVLVNE